MKKYDHYWQIVSNWGAQGTFMMKKGDFLPSLVDSVFWIPYYL